jgi:hypothetical protein
LTFPDNSNSNSNENIDTNKFIDSLLDKKPNRRFCSLRKLKKLKFLEGFSWDDFNDFRMEAPYIPKIKDYSNSLGDVKYLYEEFNNSKVINFF